MVRTTSAIPVGTQFSPDLVNLRAFCREAIESQNQSDLQDRAWAGNVRIAPPKNPPTKRQRNLPLEAAAQYGLLDTNYRATSLAEEIADLSEEQGLELFAKHILLHLGGLRVVEAVQQMQKDRAVTGQSVTGDSLARYLTSQGFPVSEHNTAINSLRMWLAKVGVFSSKGWEVDEVRKAELVGLSDGEIATLVGMSEDSQAMALALCRIRPDGWILASEVREHAETIEGHSLPRSSLPKLLDPLQAAGLVEYRSGGTRSGKSVTVRTTDSFSADVLQPFLEFATEDLDPVITAYYAMDLASIREALDSDDRHKKGQALEVYAVTLMRLLGLRFVEWRLRGDDTGGAEIDVVLEGVMGAVPTRWQVQCKNTRSKVGLDEVAKEVGLVPVTKATHLMLLTTSDFSSEARRFAEETMRNSSLSIFLIGGSDFNRILESQGAALLGILKGQSARILDLHRVGHVDS